MKPGVSSGRERYATAVSGLWNRLSRALAELEEIASTPDERLGDETLEELPPLQYALHAASELAHGIEPPPGAEAAHAELAASLAAARDATAELAETLELEGAYAAEMLLPEWRGALFRVRLARLRVATPQPLPAALEAEPEPHFSAAALTATLLSIAGAVVFAAGATLTLWPVWALGLALFAAGMLVFRPRP